jgi:N-carbamoylputrescine amidase
MLDELRVAAVAVDSRPGETDRNFDKIAHWTERAAAAGVALALFPELSLTGFIPNHPQGDHQTWLREALVAARRGALRIDSAVVEALKSLAARHSIVVSVGMLEDAGNVLFNTQLLVAPDGTVEPTRKMHVPMFEMPFYNPGPGPRVVETTLARIGTNICFDALLPESTRLLAVQNVEVVLFPFAADPQPCTPEGWAAWAAPALCGRCQENGVFGVAVNYVGRVQCAGACQSFPGGGVIVSPRGELIAPWSGQPGEPDMLLATLRADDLLAARAEPEYLFRFRRPELYGPLAK